MEVRPDILEKLICSVCGEYLSCVPIRMKNDGAALCGRCCDPEDEPTLRITPYEELAQMVVFPCANKSHGCTETLYMAEMKDHEEGCIYRQYVCPVTESGQCDWSGCRKDILDHCTQQHQDNMLKDPCTFQHQIRDTNHKTFLLAAFQMLFIIHCKVCLTSKNIYHSVRLIGASVLASKHSYELEVSNNGDTLIRRKDVAPQGCMSLQEDMAVELSINTMLQFLGEFNDIVFKITLGRKCAKCSKCVNCSKCAVNSVWPTNAGWCCEGCAPATRPCKLSTKGCTYIDTDKKIEKHELEYCAYRTVSDTFGNAAVSRGFLYNTMPSQVTKEAEVTWQESVVNEYKHFFVTTTIGKLLYAHKLDDSNFTLVIRSPLHTEELSNYKCVVSITNPAAGYKIRKEVRLWYNVEYDWQLLIPKEEFLMYVSDNKFDIKMELIKN